MRASVVSFASAAAKQHRVPPIIGNLRKGLVFDMSVAFGGGTVAAWAYWYGYHLPAIRVRDEYYLSLEQEKTAARASAISSYVADGK